MTTGFCLEAGVFALLFLASWLWSIMGVTSKQSPDSNLNVTTRSKITNARLIQMAFASQASVPPQSIRVQAVVLSNRAIPHTAAIEYCVRYPVHIAVSLWQQGNTLVQIVHISTHIFELRGYDIPSFCVNALEYCEKAILEGIMLRNSCFVAKLNV
ncbi:uncharacterized protein EDB91DRAFT_1084485 [Suillus paluster]|uniref:uncharacterized protein n=1 Tax=Suillus paluster TaxID=48578 RepID=UPI001B8667A0|nr:uncharacterized protein EDB91DRAFT_1084485 [Suillus paluster]KAG1733207.1 hypothetical protein EDB91DRAFT_1084485 [Suillus paluster]